MKAGHIVVAWACDIGVKGVSIIPGVKLGHAEFEYTDEQDAAFEVRDPIFIDRMILTGLVGQAAEYTHLRRSSTVFRKASRNQDDKRKMCNLLGRIGRCTKQDYQFYRDTTLHLICVLDIWSIVEQLAQLLLLTNGVLTALQIERLAKSTPKFPPDFWQRLEANCLGISSPGEAI
jgi:hypothetical protein